MSDNPYQVFSDMVSNVTYNVLIGTLGVLKSEEEKVDSNPLTTLLDLFLKWGSKDIAKGSTLGNVPSESIDSASKDNVVPRGGTTASEADLSEEGIVKKKETFSDDTPPIRRYRKKRTPPQEKSCGDPNCNIDHA